MKPELLTDEERAIYEWQMLLPGFGETAQRRLKAASVLVSRVGGVGGAVALQLAAAGVGRLVLAHGGDLKPSDLNRQLLQRHERIGMPRMDSILEQLKALNPRLELVAVRENISSENASTLVQQAHDDRSWQDAVPALFCEGGAAALDTEIPGVGRCFRQCRLHGCGGSGEGANRARGAARRRAFGDGSRDYAVSKIKNRAGTRLP